jgi:hypothetical protein
LWFGATDDRRNQYARNAYRSGTNPNHPDWDVLHIIYHRSEQAVDSFLIALRPDGTVIQVSDVIWDRWEVVTKPDVLEFYRSRFAERDRLRTEQGAKESESNP